MRTLVLGLVCITALHGKPLKDGEQGHFKYPGGSIPGDFLEAREPDMLNGIYNKGGLGMSKTKRQQPAEGNENGGQGPNNAFSQELNHMTQQISQCGEGTNIFIIGKKKPSGKNKRSADEPAKPAEGNGGGLPFSFPGNVNSMNGQFQQVMGGFNNVSSMNPMGGNMPWQNSGKSKRSADEPAKPAEGNGGGLPFSFPGNMNQMSGSFQQAMGGFNNVSSMNPMGGNMPWQNSGKSKRSADEPAKPAEGNGGGLPFSFPGNMNQMSGSFQQAMGGFNNVSSMNPMGGNMPWQNSGKSKRSADEPAKPAEGSGSSNGFPQFPGTDSMNGMTGQFQQVMGGFNNVNPMGGNMPWQNGGKSKRSADEPAKPAEGNGGGLPFSLPGNMNNMNGQFQQVMGGFNNVSSMNPMGGNMPWQNSGKNKRSADEPAKPAEGNGGGLPFSFPGNMNQMSGSFQQAMGGFNNVSSMNPMGGNMPWQNSGKNKRSADEPAKPTEGNGGGLPFSFPGNVNNMNGQFQQVMGGFNNVSSMNPMGGNMPWQPSGKSKRTADEPAKPAEGSGSSNGFPQFPGTDSMNGMTGQFQQVMGGFNNVNPMGGNMPWQNNEKNKRSADEPAKPAGGNGGGLPFSFPGDMNQMSGSFQQAMGGFNNVSSMNPMGGNMPWQNSGKSKRSADEPAKPAEGNGGGLPFSFPGNMNNMNGQFQQVMGGFNNVSSMNPMEGNMPWQNSGKNKRSADEPAKPAEGSGSGNGFPQFPGTDSMNGMTGQFQQVMGGFNNVNPMGGNMPWQTSGKSKRSADESSKPSEGSGSGGGFPQFPGTDSMNGMTGQFQQVMGGFNGVNPMGGNMPWQSSGKSKRSAEEPSKPSEGSESGNGFPQFPGTDQMTGQFQQVMGGFNNVNSMNPMGGNMPWQTGGKSK